MPNPLTPEAVLRLAKETMPLYVDASKSYAQMAGAAIALTVTFREKILGETGKMRTNWTLMAPAKAADAETE